VSKGPKFALEIVKEETDLTVDMLASGSWKAANFSQWPSEMMLLLFWTLLTEDVLFCRAVQLQGLGRKSGLWSSSPPQQDATRISVS
jgi:hypothetical protein